MHVILSGGAGYIGVPLAAALLEAGHSVSVFDQFHFGAQVFGPWREHARLRLIQGDIRSANADLFRGADAVIQLAALSNDPTADLDREVTRAINLTATVRCAHLAREAGVERYLFSSSCSVYGDSQGWVDENSTPEPVSLYAQYKLEAEVALHSLATESFCVTSLRSATVYGVAPRMRFDLVVNIMTLHAWKRGRLFVLGGGRQWRPLVHVSDVAQAFVLALQAPANLLNRTILNVGDNAQNFQVRDIAEIVRCVVPNTRVEQVSEDDDNRSYRVAFDKAEQLLGFKTKHHVEDGVKEILEGLEKGELRDDISTQTLAFYRNLFDDRRVMGK